MNISQDNNCSKSDNHFIHVRYNTFSSVQLGSLHSLMANILCLSRRLPPPIPPPPPPPPPLLLLLRS